MPHFNPKGATDLFDVVRAIHTKKMHYLNKVQESMKDATHKSELLKFMTCYPDTSPASGGYTRLNPKGWDWLRVLGLSDWPDFVKHIVAQHAGEARMVGDCWWEDLVEMTPQWDKDGIRVSDGLEIARKPCFWHHQLMTTTETRSWMAERQGEGNQGEQDLTDSDIEWLMSKQEVPDETAILRRQESAVLGATGAKQYTWHLRRGNYIVLAELFNYGKYRLSCHDLYNSYMNLPLWIRRKIHGVSNTAHATYKRNSAGLRHRETGHWGHGGAGKSWHSKTPRKSDWRQSNWT